MYSSNGVAVSGGEECTVAREWLYQEGRSVHYSSNGVAVSGGEECSVARELLYQEVRNVQ